MAGTAVVTSANSSKRGGKRLTRVNIALTCVSGAVSAQGIGSYFGRIVAVILEPTAGAGATMTSTADLSITDALTGAEVFGTLNFGTARSIRPSAVVTSAVGVAVTAATTANDVNRDIYVAGKLNIAIANATTTDTGYVGLIIEEG